jgi:hypothetical protein
MIRVIAHKINTVCLYDNSPRVLILDIERFREDIQALCNTEKVSLLSIPVSVQDKLTAISEYRTKNLFCKFFTKYSYFDNDSNKVCESNNPSDFGLTYIRRILPKILKSINIDCVLSCGMLYVRNINWEKSLVNGKYPFFCIHREAVGLSKEVSNKMHTDFYKFNARSYYGDMLFVGNQHFKELLIDVKYVQQNNIRCVGSPKIDNLVRLKNIVEAPVKRRSKVVLFSFYHTYLLVKLRQTKGKWSNDGSYGFYYLFDQVHCTMGKFAHDNPEVDVVLKIKWYEEEWIDRIKKSISKGGLDFDDIQNITIDFDTSGQELILSSDVVVGFNSTVITESILLGVNTIIPIYCEALNKYKKEVLWRNTKDCCVAKSDAELLSLLSKSISKNRVCHDNKSNKNLIEAFGYIDGNNSNRLINEIVKYINNK